MKLLIYVFRCGVDKIRIDAQMLIDGGNRFYTGTDEIECNRVDFIDEIKAQVRRTRDSALGSWVNDADVYISAELVSLILNGR